MDNHVSKNVEHDFVLAYLSSLDCSRSLAIAIMYRYGEYEQIINLSFTPIWYNDFATARDSLLATELLRKHADLPTSVDKDQVCLEKFYESEELCRETNDLFFSAALLPNYHILSNARRKIEKILGSFQRDEFVDSCCWGPGATLSIKRKDATYANKFRNNSEFTLASYNFVKTWFTSQFPNWLLKPRIYEGSRIITVPKTAKTNRVIAIEPSVNLFLQKGIGSMIRSRLRTFGVNLNSQERNQQLAKIASEGFSGIATVDFSAASDTISYWLVEFLLPQDWFTVMNKIRSPRGACGDSLVEFEKFSSMGNGFTFELESLIFYAIADSVVPIDHPLKSVVSIFGDDLICPSDLEDVLIDVFKTCGFTINTDKTYFSGYYRESCGSHFWDGIRIAPMYIRRHIDSIDEAIKVHNQTVRTNAVSFYCELPRWGLTPAIAILRNLCSRKGVPYVPPHYGDLGLITPFDVAQPKTKKCNNLLLFVVWHRQCKQRFVEEDDVGFLLEKLIGLHVARHAEGPKFDDALPRGNRRVRLLNTVKLVKSFTWDWPCLSTYFNR